MNTFEHRIENAVSQKDSDRFKEIIAKFLSELNKLQVKEVISCCNKRIEQIKIDSIKANGKAMVNVGESHPLYKSIKDKVGIVLERSSTSAKIEFENEITITIPIERLMPIEEEKEEDKNITSDQDES